MERYSIKDLTAISQTTEKSVRNLFKTNKELRDLAKYHIIHDNRNVYYDSVVYEWFCKRYKKEDEKSKSLIENKVGGGDFKNEDGEITKHSPAPTNDEEERQKSAKLKALSAELEDLKGKYEALQADFNKVEGERVELLRQNGIKTDEINHLLLLLSQEKAEKQALLPPPRKTIGERIRSIFKRSPAD